MSCIRAAQKPKKLKAAKRPRALYYVFLFLIKFYRQFFSLHFGGACRFYPSCSLYAEQVFFLHPPLKAFLLVLKRLSKCHFFGHFGPDPAPVKASK